MIIFCDKFKDDSFKFEHDSFKFKHDSFKFDKRQINILINILSKMIFTIFLDTMRQIKLLIAIRREYNIQYVF